MRKHFILEKPEYRETIRLSSHGRRIAVVSIKRYPEGQPVIKRHIFNVDPRWSVEAMLDQIEYDYKTEVN